MMASPHAAEPVTPVAPPSTPQAFRTEYVCSRCGDRFLSLNQIDHHLWNHCRRTDYSVLDWVGRCLRCTSDHGSDAGAPSATSDEAGQSIPRSTQ
jgi:DNA-directed RNA polymerase subunit RPC12/RpoP